MKLTPARVDEADAFSALLATAFADYARGLGRDRPGPYDWVPARLERGEGFWLGEGRLGATVLSQTGHIAKLCMHFLINVILLYAFSNILLKLNEFYKDARHMLWALTLYNSGS